MRGDHLDALRTQLLIELIAVVGFVADEVVGLGLDHVEVEAELHQADFVMVRGMRADRQRQAVAIDNCHDFQAFAAFRRANLGTATLGHREARVDEAFFLVERALVAKLIGDVGQNGPQHFAVTPNLKPTMNRFVVRIALRQHVPLRSGRQYPQCRFENLPSRNRLATRTAIGNVLFRKMIPDTFPLLVRQPNHTTLITDRLAVSILR